MDKKLNKEGILMNVNTNSEDSNGLEERKSG